MDQRLNNSAYFTLICIQIKANLRIIYNFFIYLIHRSRMLFVGLKSINQKNMVRYIIISQKLNHVLKFLLKIHFTRSGECRFSVSISPSQHTLSINLTWCHWVLLNALGS
jgi:hypothetical protein